MTCKCGHHRHDHDWWGSGPCLECDCSKFDNHDPGDEDRS